MCICVYVYMCICVYVYMCICVYVYMCICVYVYMCICVYVYMCICVYVYMCICVYVYMCICVCVYIYIYIYIYVRVCVCVRMPVRAHLSRVPILGWFKKSIWLGSKSLVWRPFQVGKKETKRNTTLGSSCLDTYPYASRYILRALNTNAFRKVRYLPRGNDHTCYMEGSVWSCHVVPISCVADPLYGVEEK